MKKIFTLMLGITIAIAVNAANYFVDTTLKTGSNNGSSWADAFQTWPAYTATVSALPTLTFTHTTTGSTTSLAFFASGVNTITLTTLNTSIVVGDVVSGTGITTGTTVTAMNGLTVTLSQNTTSATKIVNNVYVKGSLLQQTTGWTVSDNYYGSFDPGSSNTDPALRPMNDNDGNGIIEPWEFKYPTVFSSTYTGTGTAITLTTSTTLDGFTITQTALPKSINAAGGLCVNPVGGIIKNCVFSGSNLSYPAMTTGSPYGCIIRTSGTLLNSLFEKNTLTFAVTTTGTTDLKIYPILDAFVNGNTPTTNTVSGCVFRNNKVTLDYSGSTATLCNNLRGMILNIEDGGTSNTPGSRSTVTISDCLVYNNEVSFIGNGNGTNGTFAIAQNACIASHLYYSYVNTTNNWINNTFANNKSTNLRGACMALYIAGNSPDFVINNAYNNVFWNNQNTITSTSTTSKVTMASGSGQNVGTVISNNVMDGPTTGNWGTVLTYTNNLLDLSALNSGDKAPYFKNPTTLIGANRIAGSADSIAIAHSDWSLNQGSYLAWKGTPTFILTDKAGNAFTTTPAAGAYEYLFTAAVEIIRNDLVFGKVIKNTFISGIDAKIDIYSTLGKLTRSIVANKGQEISLPAGVYLVKAKTAQGIFVQKICI
jgi:hypothetical protein